MSGCCWSVWELSYSTCVWCLCVKEWWCKYVVMQGCLCVDSLWRGLMRVSGCRGTGKVTHTNTQHTHTHTHTHLCGTKRPLISVWHIWCMRYHNSFSSLLCSLSNTHTHTHTHTSTSCNACTQQRGTKYQPWPKEIYSVIQFLEGHTQSKQTWKCSAQKCIILHKYFKLKVCQFWF